MYFLPDLSHFFQFVSNLTVAYDISGHFLLESAITQVHEHPEVSFWIPEYEPTETTSQMIHLCAFSRGSESTTFQILKGSGTDRVRRHSSLPCPLGHLAFPLQMPLSGSIVNTLPPSPLLTLHSHLRSARSQMSATPTC